MILHGLHIFCSRLAWLVDGVVHDASVPFQGVPQCLVAGAEHQIEVIDAGQYRDVVLEVPVQEALQDIATNQLLC